MAARGGRSGAWESLDLVERRQNLFALLSLRSDDRLRSPSHRRGVTRDRIRRGPRI